MNLPAEIRRRKALARSIAKRGGNMAEYARTVGVSPAGALKWLRAHAPHEHQLLVSGPRSKFTPEQTLARLLLFKVHKEMRMLGRLAKAFGCSQQALSQFVAHYAPDGLDAAIADLWPEDAHG